MRDLDGTKPRDVALNLVRPLVDMRSQLEDGTGGNDGLVDHHEITRLIRRWLTPMGIHTGLSSELYLMNCVTS
jgi:hypothetical protein